LDLPIHLSVHGSTSVRSTLRASSYPPLIIIREYDDENVYHQYLHGDSIKKVSETVYVIYIL